MQYTQIKELNILIQAYRSPKNHAVLNRQTDITTIPQTVNKTIFSSYQTEDIQQILKDIDFHAKSLMIPLGTPQSNLIQERRTITQNDRNSIRKSKQAELMFEKCERQATRTSSNGRNSELFKRKNLFKKREKYIKVYYFGLPICKNIQYTKQMLVEDVIEKAIFAYIQEITFDHKKINTTKKQAYVLRLVDDDQNFKPDLELEPLDPKMKICETLFDTVILMSNNSIQFGLEAINQFHFDNKCQKNSKLIYIYDEDNTQIKSANFENTCLVSQIYEYINVSKKYKRLQYYLSDNLDGIYQISKDISVNQLQSNKLYINIKKFADQPQYIIQKQQSKDEDLEFIQSIIPISVTQASVYQQFEVIKINEQGIRQHRILGIDQNKIYNFDKEFRKNRKQIGFLSRALGKDKNFGTKNPIRLIKDIKSIKQIKNKNQIQIIVMEGEIKTKRILIESTQFICQKIFRKLSFLINLKLNQLCD